MTTYLKAPDEGTPRYITPGKEYRVLDPSEWDAWQRELLAGDPQGAVNHVVEDDTGTQIYCLPEGCCHLYGREWQVIERDEQHAPAYRPFAIVLLFVAATAVAALLLGGGTP